MKYTVCCLLVLSVLAYADAPTTITTRDGATYSNVTVTRVEPDGITIRHDAGLIKLFFRELPQDLRDYYGADPEKARAYSRQQAQSQQQFQERAREADQRAQADHIARLQDAELTRTIRASRREVTGRVLQVQNSLPWRS
jgi:hypothetical protein